MASTPAVRDQRRREWRESAEVLMEAVAYLSAQARAAGDDAYKRLPEDEQFRSSLDLVDQYAERSQVIGEMLAGDLGEPSRELDGSEFRPGLYDPVGALLATCAADLAFALSLEEADPEFVHAPLEGWLELEQPSQALAAATLAVRVFEADEALAGRHFAGAAQAVPVPSGYAFVDAAISKLVDDSARTISSTFTKVALGQAASAVITPLLTELPTGLGNAIARTVESLNFVREKIVKLVGVALDKLTVWLGEGAKSIIQKGREWVESSWANLRDLQIASSILRFTLQSESVNQKAVALLNGRDGAQIAAAEASLVELQHRHGKRLTYAGHAITALGILNVIPWLPDPSKIIVLAGAGAVVFGTAWLCADALDSPSIELLPQRTDGVIKRIEQAVGS
ncbi:hypothetical protein [Streptomyces chartreusis]|uniref:hypothetical protein n=1 Tax=Streptomyces chartreusis TaxID=1969 RepID=UPI0035D67E67